MDARENIPVGGATEPPRSRAYDLAVPFADSWKEHGVTPRDVLTILTIATLLCRIVTILYLLFHNRDRGRCWHERRIYFATCKHWPHRSRAFCEQFASELTEYCYLLADNVPEGELRDVLHELHRSTLPGDVALG